MRISCSTSFLCSILRVSESKLWLGKRLSNRFFHRSAGAGVCVQDPDVHTHSHSCAHRRSQVHAHTLAQLSSHRAAWHFHPDRRARPDPKTCGHRIQTQSPGSTPHIPLLLGFFPSAVTPTSPSPPHVARAHSPGDQEPTGLTGPLRSLVYSLWPALIAGMDLEGSALSTVSAS